MPGKSTKPTAPRDSGSPTTAQAVMTALGEKPGATTVEIAEMARIGRSTAGKALTQLAAEGAVARIRGGMKGARILPDTWALAAPVAAAADGDGATPTGVEGGGRKRGAGEGTSGGERLGKGGLQTLIVEHLQALNGKEGTSSSVAKALGRSSGATGNALQRLAEQGTIVQTCSTPRRYAWRG